MKRILLALTVFMVAVSAFSVVLQKPINAFALENNVGDYEQEKTVSDEYYKPLGETSGDCRYVLGSSFNYLNAKSAADVRAYSIFDRAKLFNLVVAKDIKYHAEIGNVFGFIANGVYQVPHFQPDFKFDSSYSTIEPVLHYNSDYTFYFLSQTEYISHTMSIVDGLSKETYANCYSDRFINNLNKLNGDTLSVEEFIALYGTHIIWRAEYGQKLDYVFEFYASDTDADQFFSLALDAATNGIYNSEYVKKYGNSYKIRYMTSGGQTTKAMLAKIHGNVEDTMISSDNESDNVFIGCGADDYGLIPVWDLFPDEYADAAIKVKTEYDKLYAEREKEQEKIQYEKRKEDAKMQKYYEEQKNKKQAASASEAEKGCSSSVNSSSLLLFVPCALAVLLTKKRINKSASK